MPESSNWEWLSQYDNAPLLLLSVLASYRYCNANYLVIVTNKSPSWTANLDDVPNPPGGTTVSSAGWWCTRCARVGNGAARVHCLLWVWVGEHLEGCMLT